MVAVLEQVRNKKLKQRQAAEILGISDRQVRNLLAVVKVRGVKGLISKKRGLPSNNQKPNKLKEDVLSLLQSKYEGFGPTFASKKLEELDNIKVHAETLRLWMISSKLWIPKQKNIKTHPSRERRACFGELIQVDGSRHRWFGMDGPAVTLLVFIDDATSKVTTLRFCNQETLNDYFKTLETHLKRYGIPRGIYTDRLKVFNGEKQLSQFQQALHSLGVESILAYFPEAKGRVERVNRTLQDRLVKELALRGIKTIDEANEYLPKYLEVHNEKFPVEPASSFDAHRPLEKDYDLERLLCRREERTLSKDYVFQFHNRFYKINETPEIKKPKGRKIEVRITRKGKIRAFLGPIELKFSPLDEIIQPSVMTREEVLFWKPKNHKPVPSSHPWKRGFTRGKRKKDQPACFV
ncbi:MAG: ISNCY family transposase [Waddliaceae bacterium]